MEFSEKELYLIEDALSYKLKAIDRTIITVNARDDVSDELKEDHEWTQNLLRQRFEYVHKRITAELPKPTIS